MGQVNKHFDDSPCQVGRFRSQAGGLKWITTELFDNVPADATHRIAFAPNRI